jgi:hypothetical protein
LVEYWLHKEGERDRTFDLARKLLVHQAIVVVADAAIMVITAQRRGGLMSDLTAKS